jgi:hypothetical protein
MVVTIHQPEHMPWSGFFHKMALADQYVVLDNVQFRKNYWQNRNRIVTQNGEECYLTVPVLLKGHTSGAIKDIKVNNSEKWQKKYWGRIQNAYSKYPYWKDYCGKLEEIILFPHYEFLLDINLKLINFFRDVLSIRSPMVMASDLNVEGHSTSLLIDICKKCGATQYLSGPSGRDYMEMEKWEETGIKVFFHEFSPPVYQADPFISGLSALDIIMRFGPDSAGIIGIAQKESPV